MALPVSRSLSRRTFLAASLTAPVAARLARADAPVQLDDASHLNPTPVTRHVVMKTDAMSATIERVRRELKEAATAGRPVAMGAARHSMGGQSLVRDGTAFTFETAGLDPDRQQGIYRVDAGARWYQVVASLDPLGVSPAVTQANCDFGVASTFSVNAHGWPVPHGPFGSTVRALRLMLADGSVVTCSRQENPELFRHAMGGYGLFGVILDLDVEMVPNLLMQPSLELVEGNDFAPKFLSVCHDPAVNMAYGRLDVSRERFLDQALIMSYRPLPPGSAPLPPAEGAGLMARLTRGLYRAEVGSETAKHLRWFMEKSVAPHVGGHPVTRNTLLNDLVINLANGDSARTDILHEYFVPPDRFPDFLTACRDVILKSRQELLNVTLRFVEADEDSVLRYAAEPRICAVMSFSQLKTPEAEADMRRMTQALIERVLAIGGVYYLPYRLHAKRDQVERAYPGLAGFIETKRRYDPGLLFRNALWDSWTRET